MFLSLLDARIAYYNCRQTAHQSNAQYLALFTANIQVLEYYKATISESHLLIDDDCGLLDVDTCQRIARDRTIAMAFLKGADPRRYCSLWSDLANQQNQGNDQYPKDLTAAYSMLVNYLGPNQTRQLQPGGNQVSSTNSSDTGEVTHVPASVGPHTFAQPRNSPSTGLPTASVVPGSDGASHNTITCFNCNANRHYATACPSAVSLVQHTCLLAQTNPMADDRHTGIPNHWILLDSQSSISVFNNKSMISNIRNSPQEVCVIINGGEQTSTQIGDITNLGTVWYNPKSIANILSLSDV
jgi:hypothetical protein